MKKLLFLSACLLALLPFSMEAQGSSGSLLFDGVDDYVDLGDSAMTGVRTIEMWFKPNVNMDGTNPQIVPLIGRNNPITGEDYELGIWFRAAPSGGGGSIRYGNFDVNKQYVDSDTSFWSANQWYHVAAVTDPVAGMMIYINGIKQTDTDTSYTNPHIYDINGTAIGAWGYSGLPRYFPGEIDEVRFWTTARTESEIQANMCQKLTGTEAGLVVYYNFDDTSSTTLQNIAAGPGPNGSILGPVRFTSGAPIGDTSLYIYPANWSGVSLGLTASEGDIFTIDNISGNPRGAHVYRVDEFPNSDIGLVGTGSNAKYFGTFIPGGDSVSYSVSYDFTAYAGIDTADEADAKLYSRLNNGWLTWSPISGTVTSRVIDIVGESNIGLGQRYRAEYMLGQDSISVSIFELENNASMVLGPNPVTQTLNIWIEGEIDFGSFNIEVVNVLGQSIKYQTVTKAYSTIDVKDLQAGTYWLIVKSKDRLIATDSFIKH